MRFSSSALTTSLRWLIALLIFSAAGLLLPSQAHAQYVDRDDSVRFEKDVKNQFYIAPRIRAIVVPDWLLGMWYDEHASHWDGQSNLAYGLEFVWRKVGAYEISTAVEYADLSMPSQFWLESGDKPNEADYTEIDLKLLSVVVSGYWYWDAQKWLSPYVGGGIGAGIMLGNIVRYQPVAGSSCETSLGGTNGFASDACFGDDGKPNPSAIDMASRKVEDSVPPVVPIINITGGLRFNMGKYAIAKLEVGFYDYFFAGLSLGGQW